MIRILLVGSSAYIAIVLILRISGKRTLASMSAFDFIIAVAVGAVFGRTLTTKDLSISEAVTAFLLKIFNTTPTLLFYKGKFLEKNLHDERLDKSKVPGAARKKGYGSMDDVAAVILEIDASFSVIGKSEGGKKLHF